MKKLKEQLKVASKELGKLTKQVEKAAAKVDKFLKAEAKKAAAKKTAAKKTAAKKAPAKKKVAAKKAPAKKTAAKKTAAKKTAAKKTAAKKPAAKKTVAKKKVTKKAAPKKAAAKKPTVLEAVFGVIGKSRNGATIAQLKQKTGLSPRQLSNALYKLSTRGKIAAKSRGLYVKK